MSTYDDLVRALAEEVGLPPAILHAAIQAALDDHDVAKADEQRDRLTRLRLLELEASLRVTHDVGPGDLVRFKDGMRNKLRPGDGEPAVVVARLSEPVFDTQEGAGSTYFREPLDLVVGVIDEDGDFVTYHVDSRRMQPVDPS